VPEVVFIELEILLGAGELVFKGLRVCKVLRVLKGQLV
jgi:hypothetical protein